MGGDLETFLKGSNSFTTEDWHARYCQQSRWTRQVRRHLFTRVEAEGVKRILEVGCGTGAILEDLRDYFGAQVEIHGIDINEEYLEFARVHHPQAILKLGDGHELPYPAQSFDLVCCHFLLLWVKDPVQVVREMRRVARPGGLVLALAEPDYGGRIDFPEALVEVARAQMEALERQGADARIGRKLRSIFSQTGIQWVECGVLGGQWQEPPSQADLDLEWRVLRQDLRGRVNKEELQRCEQLDRQAWKQGERVLYVPTFYASGWV